MTLEADLKALRSDATAWDTVADTTSTAAGVAGTLHLSEGALSFASRTTGLLATYALVQTTVTSLLNEATTNYRDLADALCEVASAYETHDQSGANILKGVWDPR